MSSNIEVYNLVDKRETESSSESPKIQKDNVILNQQLS
ncbi:hypothetical protein AALP_AA3G251900 [Arabis alpina]|uniref:Uncharacterized protein n=1 Tax=Arabis alpina TaxID=50452 RepID=A0A087HBJ9_ARAAL|nr:hypothetical protein AALP_AA3G251900 [Arabis alpina]